MTACRGCGSRLPPPFLDLGEMPLANAYRDPSEADRPELRYPLAVALCEPCNLVQLTHTVPPEALFTDYAYFSSTSASFLDHAARMADDLATRFRLGARSRVVEVASNDGYLLQFFQRKGIPVLGVEAARNVAEAARARGIPTLATFFGPGSRASVVEELRGAPDLIIGNNVLAHVPDILPFLGAVRETLVPDGVAVFEFPHLLPLLARTEFDTIYHEHVFYYSLGAVASLAARAGLELFDVSPQPVHGGSLRVFLSLPGRRRPAPDVGVRLEEERTSGLASPGRYAAFAEDVRRLQRRLVETLAGLRARGARLAAYGAPAKGNTLLNSCGITSAWIEFTVDRSPHKQGKLLPGSRIPVRPAETLARERPDYALLLPWNLEAEIVSQQADYLRAGGRFIVPVPEVRILDGGGRRG